MEGDTQDNVERITDNESGTVTHTDLDSRIDAQTDSDRATDCQTENDRGTDSQTDSDRMTDLRTDSDKGTDCQTDSDRATDCQTDSGRGTDCQTDNDRGTDYQKDNDKVTYCQTDNDRGTDYQTDSYRIIDNDIWTEDQTDSRTDIGNVTDEDEKPTDKDDAQEMVFGTNNKETDFLVTCCEGIKINLHSLYFIRNKLADEIIDSYMLTLLRKSEYSLQYINCALMTMLLSRKHQSVVTEYDFVSEEAIGVYNVGRKHWILIIIKFKTKDVLVLDPLGENGTTLKNILTSWITFLKLKGDPQLNLWKVSTLKHCKQQHSDSCGVFCLMFAEKYMIGDILEFESSKEIVLAYRNQILQCILENPDETLILKLCRIYCEEEPRGRKRDKEIDCVIHNIHIEKKRYGVYVLDTNSICTLGKCPSKGTRF